MVTVSLRPEYIISTPFNVDISNAFFTSLLVTVILSISSVIFYLKMRSHNNIIVNGIRILVFELLRLTDSITRDRELSNRVLPLVATFFIFIAAANLLAVIPGFLGSFFIETKSGNLPILRSPNSDLTTTTALAIFSVGATQIFSLHLLGVRNYVKRFINLTNPVRFVLGFFEMISEGVKILSFAFRLFGNIFAGEVLLLVIAFLVPYVVPLPFMILEIFVGIVQAFIFAVLTLTFIKVSLLDVKGVREEV